MANSGDVHAELVSSALELVASRSQSAAATQAAHAAGHLAGVDDEGRILFRPDDADEAFSVSIGVALSDDELVKAAWLGHRALAVFARAGNSQPVLVALLRERVAATARDAVRNGVNVKVDGEDVRIVAQREIELRCGKARLLLRKDGRVEISGTSIVSRSRGPVKIKGATIALN